MGAAAQTGECYFYPNTGQVSK